MTRNFSLLLLVALAGCTYRDGQTISSSISSSSISTAPTGTTLSLMGRVTDTATAGGVSAATLAVEGGSNDGKAAMSDFGGNYILMDLQPSTFRVRVTAANYATQSRTVTFTANQVLPIQLEKC